MNVPHPMVLRRELRRWEQLKKSWYVFFCQLPKLPEMRIGSEKGRGMGGLIAETSCNPELFGPEVQKIYSDAARQPGAARAMVNYYRAAMRHSDSIDPGDYKVDVPTLLLWGEEDVALNLRCSLGTENWVDDITVERFPGVSHWVQQDAPELVNGALRDWLAPG